MTNYPWIASIWSVHGITSILNVFLSWPVIILILFILYKKDICNLVNKLASRVDTLREASLGNFKLLLGEAEDSLSQINSTSNAADDQALPNNSETTGTEVVSQRPTIANYLQTIDNRYRSTSYFLSETRSLSNSRSEAAVIDGYRILEIFVHDICHTISQSQNEDVSYDAIKNPSPISRLRNLGFDDGIIETYTRLRKTRNIAAHDTDITPNIARDWLKTAENLAGILRAQSRGIIIEASHNAHS